MLDLLKLKASNTKSQASILGIWIESIINFKESKELYFSLTFDIVKFICNSP